MRSPTLEYIKVEYLVSVCHSNIDQGVTDPDLAIDQRGLMNPRDRFQFNRQQGGLVNQGAAFQPFNQRQLYRGRNRFNEFGGFPQLAQNFQNMRLQEREQRQQAREDRMNRFQGGFRPRLQGFAGRQQGAFPGQFQQQNEEDEDEPGPDHVFPPTQYATQIVKPAPGVEEAATKKSVASKSAAAAKSSLKAPPSSKYESVPFKHPNEKSTVKRPSQASSRTQKVFSATQFNSAWRGRKWSDQQVSDALVEAFEAGPHFWANFERRVGNVSRQLSQEENEEFEELLILRRRWEEDKNVLHSEIFFGRISPALEKFCQLISKLRELEN